jgi:uncharacterized membrane protein required for colicin V production
MACPQNPAFFLELSRIPSPVPLVSPPSLGGDVILQTVNWYDFVVLAALIYGAWSGLRAGLTGEIIRVIGLVLMLVLAFQFYQSLGNWLRAHWSIAEETAYLVAFVGIAVAVHLLALATRLATHRYMLKLKFAALVENVGGSLAGVIRMTVIMAWLTAVLYMMGSNALRRAVGEESRFGSFVASQVPTVKAIVEKRFPEKSTGLIPDLKRRPEPDYEAAGSTNAKPSASTGQ